MEFPVQDEMCTLSSIETVSVELGQPKYCCISAFVRHSVEMKCQFSHATDKSQPVLWSTAKYYWSQRSSAIFLCAAPTPAVDLRHYIPKVVMTSPTKRFSLEGRTPVQALVASNPKRYFLCSCLQIWRRWTALLEYLKYHRQEHGLTHTIILSQDLDTFDAAPWLQTMFSVEVVYWPHIATQSGMTSYCALLASSQCEWTMQMDVDEFLVTKDGSSLSDRLRAQPAEATVLRIPVRQIQMFPNETVLRIPAGGVIRNYQCLFNNSEHYSSVIRPSAVHPTFRNKVHFYCSAPLVVDVRDAEFYHYSTQAWELYYLKYLRNVATGVGFYGTPRNVSLGHIEPEYLLMAKECDGKTKDLSVHSRFWKRTTLLAPRGSQDVLDLHALESFLPADLETHNVKILLTGTFGEEPLLSLARNLYDLRSPSRVIADPRLALKIDVDSSLQHANSSVGLKRARASLLGLQSHHLGTFTHLVHLRMHPLRSVAELAAMNETEWAAADLLTNTLDDMLAHPPLTRALYHWVAMNQYLDMVAQCGFTVEGLVLRVQSSTSAGSRECPKGFPGRVLSNFEGEDIGVSVVQAWRKSYAELRTTSWEELQAAAPLMARTACAMSMDYGYKCPLLPPEANFFTKFYPKDVSSESSPPS
eukprot:m.514301 g.514301  ORF g.514301 m.514301 type:complete len:643 (+) comp57448_c0_seq49:820-2748(+)